MQLLIETRHDLSAGEVDALEDRLYEHNRSATGRDDARGIALLLRDGSGQGVGAVAGHSWAGVAELKQLWVAEARRGQGHGHHLLRCFIDECRRRQVRTVWVQSFSFQAPGLYEKAGFERVAEFEGWPEGHSNVVLRMTLEP